MLRRLIGEDIELKTAAGRGPLDGQGGPGTDRAGHPEPGRERPRRDAERRHADDRDRERRSSTRASLATTFRPSRALTCCVAVSDTGRGHGRRGQGAPLRALLHDQGAREGNGSRALDGLRDRQAERRLPSGATARSAAGPRSGSFFHACEEPVAQTEAAEASSRRSTRATRPFCWSKTSRKCALSSSGS